MQVYKEALKHFEKILGKESTFDDDLNRVGRLTFGKKWLGVYPSDLVPPVSKQGYMIVNLDDSTMPGSHWIAIVNQKGKRYIYDSFGRDNKTLIDLKGGQLIDSDKDSEQGIKQNNCGQRSLSWIFVFDQYGKKKALSI